MSQEQKTYYLIGVYDAWSTRSPAINCEEKIKPVDLFNTLVVWTNSRIKEDKNVYKIPAALWIQIFFDKECANRGATSAPLPRPAASTPSVTASQQPSTPTSGHPWWENAPLVDEQAGGAQVPAPALSDDQLNSIYQAYKTGEMTRKEEAEYEQDVRSGEIALPPGAKLRNNKKTTTSVFLIKSEPTACYKNAWNSKEDGGLGIGMTAGLAIKLCTGTTNSKKTISCFTEAYSHPNNSGLGLNMGQAVELCKTKLLSE